MAKGFEFNEKALKKALVEAGQDAVIEEAKRQARRKNVDVQVKRKGDGVSFTSSTLDDDAVIEFRDAVMKKVTAK